MFLLTLTSGDTTHRFSIDGHALTHLWRGRVVKFDSFLYGLNNDYGGHFALNGGRFSLLPGALGEWPPSDEWEVSVKWARSTDTDPEASATLMLEGIAFLHGFNSEAVEYEVRPPDYTGDVSDGTTYNNDFLTVINSVLTSIDGVSSVNTSLARSSGSTDIDHNVSSDTPAIELADAMCQYASHMFYIDGSTAHVIAMETQNGSRTLTEHQFTPPEYWKKQALSRMFATVGSDEAKSTLYKTYGQKQTITAYHDTKSDVEAELNRLRTIEIMPRISVEMPIPNTVPSPGEKFNWTDTRLYQSTDAWLYARTLRYNFMKGTVEIEGNGWCEATV